MYGEGSDYGCKDKIQDEHGENFPEVYFFSAGGFGSGAV